MICLISLLNNSFVLITTLNFPVIFTGNFLVVNLYVEAYLQSHKQMFFL